MKLIFKLNKSFHNILVKLSYSKADCYINYWKNRKQLNNKKFDIFIRFHKNR